MTSHPTAQTAKDRLRWALAYDRICLDVQRRKQAMASLAADGGFRLSVGPVASFIYLSTEIKWPEPSRRQSGRNW